MRELKREKQERERKAREAELKAQEEAAAAVRQKEEEARKAEEAAARAKQEAATREEARKAEEARAAEEAARQAAAAAERKAAEDAAAKAEAEKKRRQAVSPEDRSEAPSDASRGQANDQSAAEFAARIRSVIGSGANDNAGPGETGTGVETTGSLPPLDAPQSVEDLLNREFGVTSGQTSQGEAQSEALSPSQSAVAGTPVQTVPAADASGAVIRPKRQAPANPPRYKTLPNGLVVTFPSN